MPVAAKKRATLTFEPSAFWGNRVKWDGEHLKLPTALSYMYQAAYINLFYILGVYFKT